ncbi:aKG-HExxH-type peptide beta-hydroxylase [Burkholderia sp. PAMC 26561]|uniref:aKG-HExxH-type peptide beta-hydroxylase n=1 Tax=Burkholderia sp. PAMC 26561 TaxID=1795043 RepID=UPI000AE6A0B5|nr:HEXXH motif-containing putative peptide modification protein [Burkholderia sp. PAMC 26561]
MLLDGACALLAQAAPEYARWVTRVLNSIVLLPHLANRSCSGSWADASGTIYMTEPVCALEAAEILVHESSHQYFHMLEKVGSCLKPGCTEMYFSPPVQKERLLDRILIAYHAFANVLIMYLKAFRNGYGDQYTVNRFNAFVSDVAVLEGYLARSDGLSDIGRSIFEPLRGALAEADAGHQSHVRPQKS